MDLKRISGIEKSVAAIDGGVAASHCSFLVLDLLSARLLSSSAQSHPKLLSIMASIEYKTNKGEKRKVNGIKAGEFGKASPFGCAPMVFPLGTESGKKQKAIENEEQFLDYLVSQNATLCLKLKNEVAVPKLSSGTMGKVRISVSEILKLRRSTKPGASEAHWISLGGAKGPELQIRSLVVFPADHLKLEDSALTIGATYTRLSNRLYEALAQHRTAMNGHVLLENFSSLFGVAPARQHLASLESNLLFGDSRVSFDRMLRLCQQLDDAEGRKSGGETSHPTSSLPSPILPVSATSSNPPPPLEVSSHSEPSLPTQPKSTLPLTIYESSLYAQLRPSVLQLALKLSSNCVESFPGNFPSGSLKRTLQLGKYLSPKEFTTALLLEMKRSAIKRYFVSMWPMKDGDDVDKAVEEEMKKVEMELKGTNNLSDFGFNLTPSLMNLSLNSSSGESKYLPFKLETFESVQSALIYSKTVVEELDVHFSRDFEEEMQGMKVASRVAESLIDLIIRSCKAYFLETVTTNSGDNKRGKQNNVETMEEEDERKTKENKKVFETVDKLAWLIKHWQVYTTRRLVTEIPIYDYLEEGTVWWLEKLNGAMQKWSADVLLCDDFEPVERDMNLLHSSSVVHLFSISHEALSVISPLLLGWETPRVWTHLETFIRGFSQSAEMYCLNIEVLFTAFTGRERDKTRVPTERLRSSSSASKQKNSSSGSSTSSSTASHQNPTRFSTPPVALKSLFAPVLKSPKVLHIAQKMNAMLRISEDPSSLLPQDARFQVTTHICVQMNNVETVRNLIVERAEALYGLYERVWAGPAREQFEPEKENVDRDLISFSSPPSTPNQKHPRDTSSPISFQVSKKPKTEMDDWIGERFQTTLKSIRSVGDGLVNALCSGLLPFIEAMLYYILRMYRSPDDGKVRNEANRLLAKLTSKTNVSDEEVTTEMEPVFEFLDYSVEVLSKNLYYAVFKRFVRSLWNGISASLEGALLPHAEKHLMKPDQIAKFLIIEAQLRDYFIYDGESLPEQVAQSTLHSHQLLAAALSKSTAEVIDVWENTETGHTKSLLAKLLHLRANNKDSQAKGWVRASSNDLSSSLKT